MSRRGPLLPILCATVRCELMRRSGERPLIGAAAFHEQETKVLMTFPEIITRGSRENKARCAVGSCRLTALKVAAPLCAGACLARRPERLPSHAANTVGAEQVFIRRD